MEEPLYKPGDFRRAIDSTHNYGHEKRKEIKISYEVLKGLSAKEKWELLEKMVKLNSQL